jgi:hypothetical protein
MTGLELQGLGLGGVLEGASRSLASTQASKDRLLEARDCAQDDIVFLSFHRMTVGLVCSG